ncbi:hypothetical protein OIU85_028865 [Salix viminalis]|uniref:Uncharacterized protein n=1 Tax=Salix viminalis TaxID=40686 RepID=A0A9Q0QB14_SALVM|nr:hypothetical protein OIU85_028865 [Salix viminalis]
MTSKRKKLRKIEDENAGKGKTNITSKDTKSQTAAENGKKRKRHSQAKEKPDSVKEENGAGTRSSTDDSTKSNGFRHNGSRRKNKPRRAAEAGVESPCQLLRVVETTTKSVRRKFMPSVLSSFSYAHDVDKHLKLSFFLSWHFDLAGRSRGTAFTGVVVYCIVLDFTSSSSCGLEW